MSLKKNLIDIRWICCLLLSGVCGQWAYSQALTEKDSLIQVWENPSFTDTVRMEALWQMIVRNYDSGAGIKLDSSLY